ncbi:hypothetical protein [Cognatiyoonia sp. IB215182]|uniref:hypothetical protein n=1 Tax=Cognatiyoonia sp. IB215182 TaxID=3097353 RepID=UPI002A23FED3|nr:hypothetical protein [Cognatiyoonia sp. IB215182]
MDNPDLVNPQFRTGFVGMGVVDRRNEPNHQPVIYRGNQMVSFIRQERGGRFLIKWIVENTNCKVVEQTRFVCGQNSDLNRHAVANSQARKG